MCVYVTDPRSRPCLLITSLHPLKNGCLSIAAVAAFGKSKQGYIPNCLMHKSKIKIGNNLKANG